MLIAASVIRFPSSHPVPKIRWQDSKVQNCSNATSLQLTRHSASSIHLRSSKTISLRLILMLSFKSFSVFLVDVSQERSSQKILYEFFIIFLIIIIHNFVFQLVRLQFPALLDMLSPLYRVTAGRTGDQLPCRVYRASCAFLSVCLSLTERHRTSQRISPLHSFINSIYTSYSGGRGFENRSGDRPS